VNRKWYERPTTEKCQRIFEDAGNGLINFPYELLAQLNWRSTYRTMFHRRVHSASPESPAALPQ
jgi:hypothetical protein